MSDSYTVKGVTITPLGGGFYELKHASITAEGNIEKVRGKENADKRAEEIGAAATPPAPPAPPAGESEDNGHIEQGNDMAALQEKVDAADANQAQADEKLTAKDDEIAALKAQLAERDKERDELLDAARRSAEAVTTVETNAEQQVEGQVPKGIPTNFAGPLDADAKKALKKAGLGYTRIILEENPDIPPTGLFVGHNGRGYQIQPGVEVDVPDFVLGVLKDAKMSAPVTDSKSLKVLGYRERMKYPYRLVD